MQVRNLSPCTPDSYIERVLLFAGGELAFLEAWAEQQGRPGRATWGPRWRWRPNWEAAGDATTIRRRGAGSCGKAATG